MDRKQRAPYTLLSQAPHGRRRLTVLRQADSLLMKNPCEEQERRNCYHVTSPNHNVTTISKGCWEIRDGPFVCSDLDNALLGHWLGYVQKMDLGVRIESALQLQGLEMSYDSLLT